MNATLEEVEMLAWAYYKDSGSSRAFEVWKYLWDKRKVDIPEGAWTS